MTDTDMLAKIRKLLAKAEDPGVTPEEAEAYNTKVAELVARYGIDRALLADSDPESDVVGDRVIPLDPPYALDKASLLGGIATTLRCRAISRHRSKDPKGRRAVHLFGFGADLERVDLLYTSLLLQATHTLATTPVPPWENAAAFRRAWLAGFTNAVIRRLAAAERRAQQDTTPAESGRSVALVLADRSGIVERAVRDTYPRLRTGRARVLTGGGYGDGHRAGQRADLGGSKLTGNRKQLGA